MPLPEAPGPSMAMTSGRLMVRLVERALGVDGGCDTAPKRIPTFVHRGSKHLEGREEFVETWPDPTGIGVQYVGPDVGVGAGDAHEIPEPVAGVVQRSGARCGVHERESHEVGQVADQGETLVMACGCLHHDTGPDRLPVTAHGIHRAIGCFGNGCHDHRSVLEQIGSSGSRSLPLGAGDRVARHEVGGYGVERFDHRPLDAAYIEYRTRAASRRIAHMVGDGTHGNGHADRIAVPGPGVGCFVDDAQFEGSVESVSITIHTDDPIEYGTGPRGPGE